MGIGDGKDDAKLIDKAVEDQHLYQVKRQLKPNQKSYIRI